MRAPVRHSRSSSSSAGALVLGLLAFAVPLARGGVDLWAEISALVLALVSLLASMRRPAVPRSALPLAAVLGVCALLLVPLPHQVHGLSPGAVRVFEVSLGQLGMYPEVRPLSLDSAATARAFLKAVACTAAFIASSRYSSTHQRRERVVLGLALSSAGVTAAVLGAALVGGGELLGPHFPFVNPNHLAGFLNLTSFVALGQAFRLHGRSRVLWGMLFAVAGATVFLSLSRAGIAGFLLGGCVFLGWHSLTRRHRDGASHPLRQGMLVGALACAAGLAAFLALDPILAELRTLRGGADDIKVRLLAPALQVIKDFPIVGIGPGAFPTVFTAYQSESSAVTFTHLENEWVQPLIDFGVPAGVLLVGTFALIWARAARRRGLAPSEIGLLAGTAALAAQSGFDFSLDVLGVAIPFAIAMGLLEPAERPVRLPRWLLPTAVAALLLVAGAFVVAIQRHELDADRDRIEGAAGSRTTEGVARDVLWWHPADWFPHAVAGVRSAAEQGCRQGMPWLLRAMALDPAAPSPHLAAARCLVGRDDRAAKREYRLAILFGGPALEEAMVRYPALVDLLEVAPMTPDGLLELGLALRRAHRPSDAAEVYRRVLEELRDERAVLPLGYVKSSQGDHEGALELAYRHAQRHPSDPAGWLVAATSLSALGREELARAEIERGLAAIPGSPPLLEFLAERAMAARRWTEAKRLADDIAARTPAEIAAKHLLAARALAGQGRIGEALDRARSATAANGTVPAPWLAVASYGAGQGRYDEAIAALRRAAALPGAPPDGYAGSIATLEEAQRSALERAAGHRALLGGAAEAPSR
jgi:tetratricopeptide (TPR) repeat protein